MYHLNEYHSTAELNHALAHDIITQLSQAIALRGKASLAVSGGRTPTELFKLLSQQTLDWDKVYITLVDDRWVDEHDEASNARLVKSHLLQNNASKAHFVGLKTAASSPFDGEKESELRLQQTIPLPFDALILGMGDDGHTASLFPHAANLANGLDMHSGRTLVGMTPLTAPLDRISLTLPTILASRQLYLHLVGENKKQVLSQASAGKDINDMPIRAVLHQDKTPLSIYWTL
ncbi:6-phosphogluconolactonase [Utexia brackfieldae]|uniref:6-phosphogluconolactonase n=1 Tax=Utexia brackfieldae TaxID=3074108 RepID=UPI00370D679F